MRDIVERVWELWYPFLCGFVHFVVVSFVTFTTEFRISGGYFEEGEIWAPFFALSAGATGILFSVFVFVMAPAAGFVEKISKLQIFDRFRGFVKSSLFYTILASVLILPIMTAKSQAYDDNWYIWLSIMASSVLVAMFLSIYRVIRIFMVWASAS